MKNDQWQAVFMATLSQILAIYFFPQMLLIYCIAHVPGLQEGAPVFKWCCFISWTTNSFTWYAPYLCMPVLRKINNSALLSSFYLTEIGNKLMKETQPLPLDPTSRVKGLKVIRPRHIKMMLPSWKDEDSLKVLEHWTSLSLDKLDEMHCKNSMEKK